MSVKPRRAGFSIVMKVSILAGSIAAFASLTVGSLIVSGSSEIVLQDALERLRFQTNIKSLKLVSDVKNLSDDAKYLVGTPPIKGIPRAIRNGGVDPFDNSNLETWRARLAIIFSEMIRAKSNYLQIRYIGVADNGKELVRVDRYGDVIRTIAESELQQKGDTHYFKKAVMASPGDVYLSDITLNREFGMVTEPHTAMFRAAAPVYFEGKMFGILVINMSFNTIFEELITTTPRELVPYVTNEEGYFLAHLDRAMTFGFDLNHDNRIQTIYPKFDLQRKQEIRETEFTIETNGDVVHVVKARFDPNDNERYIAVMLATSYQHLQARSDQLRQQSFVIMWVLVAFSLVVASVLVARLMSPLRLISKASEDLASGKEVQELPLSATDEIGDLARSFDHMRHQLEQKERELIKTQARIHYANKMSSLGEMAAGMAHEINSPLQSIKLLAQRVQRQMKKQFSVEEIDDSMTKITSSVDKVSGVIESLKNVARDSSNDDFVKVRLCDIIHDAVTITEERFRVNNVRFEVAYHELSEETIIQCQRLQISQVLINLINNAYDAIYSMKEKWIRVDISQVSDKIVIAVSDCGSGIPAEIGEKIFDPMFTTKEIGKGTGLGLSISNEIVANHYGAIYVDRDVEYTRIVLELPVVHPRKKKSL